MRPRSLLLLALALGCGLVASIGISQVMDREPEKPVSPDMVQIFVARTNIRYGEPIKPEMIKLEPWQKDRVPAGAITKVDDIQGRRAKHSIVPGVPILNGMLVGEGEGHGPSAMVPEDYRVVTVRVAAEHGANLIRVGDRVDMQVFVRQGIIPQITQATTHTFLHNIRVFAVGQQYRMPEDDGKLHTAKTVSLLVTPEQAEMVTLASRIGDIRVVMRSVHDDSESFTSGTTISRLFRFPGRGDPGKEMDNLSRKPDDVRDWLNQQAGSSSEDEVREFVMMDLSSGRPVRFTFDDPRKMPREVSGAGGASKTPSTRGAARTAAPVAEDATTDEELEPTLPGPKDELDDLGDLEYEFLEEADDILDLLDQPKNKPLD